MRAKSTTGFNNSKLPSALKPLTQRDQWTVYREEKRADGSVSRPPRQARNPDYLASVTDPSTWSDHATAAKVVKDGKADGFQFVLTKEDPFAFLDIDDGRDPTSGSVDRWAQDRLDQFNGAYKEVSPSNDGVHVIGETSTGAEKENRAFHLVIDGKKVAVEAYYHSKAMTVTGHQIGKVKKLVNVDKPLQQIIAWGERAKAKADTHKKAGKGKTSKFSVGDIDEIVSAGPIDGGNRSEQFHSVVGHYFGIGRDREQVCEVFEKHPGGVAERYISKNLLDKEVDRSFRKYEKQAKERPRGGKAKSRSSAPVKARKAPPEPALPQLPQFYAHGDKNVPADIPWAIRWVIPEVGKGLLAGWWGSYKTFIVLDIARALWSGTTFLDHPVRRTCGTLLLAYEGSRGIAKRVNAVVADKCPGVERVPFVWCDPSQDLPRLLEEDALEKLVAKGKEVEEYFQREFSLPLGFILIDTLTAAAGYSPGDSDNDTALGQILMTLLDKLSMELNCFVLGIAHLGKNQEAGIKGAMVKEDNADVLLISLCTRTLSGQVRDTRLATRKVKEEAGGTEHYFEPRKVEAPERDAYGDIISTLIIDWTSGKPGKASAQASKDPWEEAGRTDAQKLGLLLFRDALFDALKDHGTEQLIDGTEVRTAPSDPIRQHFYAHTDGDDERKRKQFTRARDRAQLKRLVGSGKFDGVTHLWPIRPEPAPATEDEATTEEGAEDET